MSYYQQIYNRLRANGITEAGALGILGNWDCESNCEPCRVQGDFSPYRTISKAYVQQLNSGSLSRETFAHDAKGFGLAQWTYFSRKAEMYDLWKLSGKAIDSVAFQVDFALHEFERDYASDLALLKTTNDIYTACRTVCQRFENPAVHNIDARFRSAMRIKGEIDLSGKDTPDPDPAPADNRMVLRTIDNHCSSWPEVWILQAVLLKRGYINTNPDGIFGTELMEAVKKYQAANNLAADGVVGNGTWNKLLER